LIYSKKLGDFLMNSYLIEYKDGTFKIMGKTELDYELLKTETDEEGYGGFPHVWEVEYMNCFIEESKAAMWSHDRIGSHKIVWKKIKQIYWKKIVEIKTNEI
jgi:hypothetical protein